MLQGEFEQPPVGFGPALLVVLGQVGMGVGMSR